MKSVYRLERVKYYFFDKVENENVEERFILGHFSSLKKLYEAISICLKNGFCEQELVISTFFDKFTHNQKYVYVLSHQYSIVDEKGMYIDYEYIFNPFSNKGKCVSLMNTLKENSKYSESSSKFYDKQSMKGFYISKQRIDHLYGIPKSNWFIN